MAEGNPRRSPDLLTDAGRQALRKRPGVVEALAANRWYATAVAGAAPGAVTAAGLLLGGVPIGWSLTAGAAVMAVVVLAIALASAVLGRPIVADLFVGSNEPGELLEGERWGTEAEAAREARRRNLGERGGYWIELEIEPGRWGIERRRLGGGGSGGGGGGGWFGGDGGGGGNGSG